MPEAPYDHAIDLGFQDLQQLRPPHLHLDLLAQGLNDDDFLSFAKADPAGEERGKPEASGASEEKRLDIRLKTSVTSAIYTMLAMILDDTNDEIAQESSDSLLGTIKRREPLMQLLDGHRGMLQQLSVREGTSQAIKFYDNIWRPRIEDMISLAIQDYMQSTWKGREVPPHLRQAIYSIDRGDRRVYSKFPLKTNHRSHSGTDIRRTIAASVVEPVAPL